MGFHTKRHRPVILGAIGALESKRFIDNVDEGITDELIKQFHSMDRNSQEFALIDMTRDRVNVDSIIAILKSTKEGLNFYVNTPVQAYSLLFECADRNNTKLAKRLLDEGIDIKIEMEGVGDIFKYIEQFPIRCSSRFVTLVEKYRKG